MAGKSRRKIGLFGATTTIIGFVIGVSIFILPGSLAAQTGPGVVLSYMFAAVLAVFSCLAAVQLSRAYPVSGASVVAIGELLSPYYRFLAVWLIVGSGAVAIALLSYGFADYVSALVGSQNRGLKAIVLVVLLTLLNLVGIRQSVAVQALMVAAFMTALLVFCIVGLANISTTRMIPFAPNGFAPILAATVPAFFSYTGFLVIVELGGEIRNPERNIPIAISISFLVVLMTYVSVSLVIVGVVPWQELANTSAAVSEISGLLLPDWAANAITMTAIAAAASSVNVLLLAYSRDVAALASAGELPALMTTKRPEERTNAQKGILAIAAISILAILAGKDIESYATVAVVAVLLFQTLVGVSVWRLTRKVGPDISAVEPSRNSLLSKLAGGGVVTVSLAFIFVALANRPSATGVVVLYVLGGWLIRTLILRSQSSR